MAIDTKFTVKRTMSVTDINFDKYDVYVRKILCSEGATLSGGSELVELKVRQKPAADKFFDPNLKIIAFKEVPHVPTKLTRVLCTEGQHLNKSASSIIEYEVEHSLESLIEESVPVFAKFKSNLSSHDKISVKKLSNAVSAYGQDVHPTRVLHLYDSTIFGSGTEGFLITDTSIYSVTFGVDFSFNFIDLDTITLEKGKPDSLIIGLKKDDRKVVIKADNGIIKIEPFYDFLCTIAATKRDLQVVGRKLVVVDDKIAAAVLSPEEIDAKIREGDLYTLLSVSSNEDLAPLVEAISGAFSESLTSSAEYKEFHPNHKRYYKKIADEIRLFGGHSILNVFRGGEGPTYGEILKDVCKKLDVKYSSEKIPVIEEALLAAHLKHAWDSLTQEERAKMREDAKGHSQRPDLKMAVEGLHMFHQLAGGHWGVVAAKSLHMAFDTAYRITVPCVLQIAFLRRKHLTGGMTLATAAAKIKRLEEQLAKASKSFEAHNKLSEFILSLWAIGFAIASCDGPVSDDESSCIAEFISGASKDAIPWALRDKINELGQTPPDFNGAMKYVEWLGKESWPIIDVMLPFVAEGDEPNERINELEEKFLEKWNAYKVLNG